MNLCFTPDRAVRAGRQHCLQKALTAYSQQLPWPLAACSLERASPRTSSTSSVCALAQRGMGSSAAEKKSSLKRRESATEYQTLAQAARLMVEVQKSKFVVTAFPVRSGTEALEKIRGASDPSASHNCWAYKLRNEHRSSDDGEPSGTAGRPILSAIEGEDLDGVAVLVTRHFGGIKLGTGGLVRAYGGAARDCLRAAPRTTVKARTKLRMTLTFDVLGRLYSLLPRFQAEREGEEEYLGGQVQIYVSVEVTRAKELIDAVADLTAGAVIPEQISVHGQD